MERCEIKGCGAVETSRGWEWLQMATAAPPPSDRARARGQLWVFTGTELLVTRGNLTIPAPSSWHTGLTLQMTAICS